MRGRSRRRSIVRPPRRAAAIALARADTGDRRPVPGDGALESLAQRRSRLEREELACARAVDAPTRLAVRFLGVPRDRSLVPRHVGDQLGEVADRDLAGRSEVDRLRAVVALCREYETLDAVVHVEELARRGPVAPQHDLVLGFDHLANE